MFRTDAQVTAFFDGSGLAGYGLAHVPLWRPDGKPPPAKNLTRIGISAGSAVKND